MDLHNPENVATQVNIIVMKDGAIMFNLPNDAMLAYGLLHLALDQVQMRTQKTMTAKEPSKILTLQ